MSLKPSAPPAPDYAAAATAQGTANIAAANQTAGLNNPNVNTPYGSQTVSYSPTGPDGGNQATINQSLTPIAQSTLNNTLGAQNDISGLLSGAAGNVAKTVGTPFNENGVPANPINPGQTGQAALLARLNPQIKQNEAATSQRLANQGIPVGSEAWNNEMRQQGQNENDLYSQAGLYGIGLDTQAHQAGLQEQLGLYNQPLNELTALMSGSQVQTPQFQSYTGGGNIGAAPVAQAAANQGNYNTAAYNSQMGALGGLYGGIGSILGGQAGSSAGLAGLFSDMRLKSNIVRVGTHKRGFGIYEYDIFGHRERGVMAQEVEKILPHAVTIHSSGYRMVNYEALDA